VLHNLGADAVTAGPYEGDGSDLIFSSGEIVDLQSEEGGWRVNLPAGASGIWRVR
jgi:hypothetical protein